MSILESGVASDLTLFYFVSTLNEEGYIPSVYDVFECALLRR